MKKILAFTSFAFVAGALIFGSVSIVAATNCGSVFPTTLNNYVAGCVLPSAEINALEAKLGITQSNVTSSLDYQVNHLMTSYGSEVVASSSLPWLSTFSPFNSATVNASTSAITNVSSTNADVTTRLTLGGVAVSTSTAIAGGNCTNCSVTFNGNGEATAFSSGLSANTDTPYQCQFNPSNAVLPNTSFPNSGRTGSNFTYNYLGFPPSTTTSAFWDCNLPTGLKFNTTTLDIAYTSTSTATGTVKLYFGWNSNASGTVIDATSTNTTTITSVYPSSTAGVVAEISTNLSSTTFQAASQLFLMIQRQGASDTLAKDAQLLWAALRFF